MIERSRTRSARVVGGVCLGCLPGLLAFLLIVGARPVGPRNIAWLADPDPAMQYMGWAFYRHAAWMLPIGANPTYGLELGSGILYSDSIPALAIVGKTVAAVLSDPFQYFGLWLLACFLLQSWFAWRLLGLATASPVVRILGTGFFACAPILIFRLSLGHFGLVGQWTILAALGFLFRPPRRQTLAWTTLVGVTAIIHTYLFAIVASLWIASVVERLVRRPRRPVTMGIECASVVIVSALCLWQAGLFLIGSGRDLEGFGAYHMNLLSPVNSAGWSYVLPALPGSDSDYEGFSYFGLGGLALIALAIVAAAKRRQATARSPFRLSWPLGVTIGALVLYACSNTIGLGRASITVPLPDAMLRALSTLRASGRLAWPAYYVVMLASLAAVMAGWRARTVSWLLAALLAVQVVDLSAGWRPLRAHLNVTPARAWASPLVDSFWTTAAASYREVRRYPPRIRPGWETWAAYAQRYRLATDAVYVARYDVDRRADLDARETADLAALRFDPNTLYVLNDELWSELACRVDPRVDLLARIDGFPILAPGWMRHHAAAGEPPRGCG